MGRLAGVVFLAGGACALALSTRVPAPLVPAAAATAAAVAATALAIAAAATARPALGALAAAACAGLLLVPPSPDAWLDLPAIVPVLPLLALASFLLPRRDPSAPELGDGGKALGRRAARLLPWLALVGVVGAFPLLARAALPARLGLSVELQGTAGPILAGLFIALACLAVALVRRALERTRQAIPDALDGPEGST